MKYILMMTGTKADFDWYATWSEQDIQAQAAFMEAFTQGLMDAGTFVATEGLGFPDQARLVRAGSDGEPITDGIFPEAKEFLAGYWIVDVESPEQAYKLAAQVSAAPHPPHPSGRNQPVEVQQVMSGPPAELH